MDPAAEFSYGKWWYGALAPILRGLIDWMDEMLQRECDLGELFWNLLLVDIRFFRSMHFVSWNHRSYE